MNGTAEKKPRSTLFGRKDLLEVYRRAKDFIIRYKLLRMCRFSDENGLKRLTIISGGSSGKRMARCIPSHSTCATGSGLKRTTWTNGRISLLPPLGKRRVRLIGASGSARTLYARLFAPPEPTTSLRREKTARPAPEYTELSSENTSAGRSGIGRANSIGARACSRMPPRIPGPKPCGPSGGIILWTARCFPPCSPWIGANGPLRAT